TLSPRDLQKLYTSNIGKSSSLPEKGPRGCWSKTSTFLKTVSSSVSCAGKRSSFRGAIPVSKAKTASKSSATKNNSSRLNPALLP
ncbi:uncharacterized protein METZ01_LOCUS487463, partial [marine metagenome]